MGDMNEIERWYAYGNENGDGPWNDGGGEDAAVIPVHSSTVVRATCYNCGAPLTYIQAMRGRLFCCDRCKQTAKVVRYARAALREGRYERDPLVGEAITLRIALILGGDGYPEKAHRLSPEQRTAIFARDDGCCRLCGAPATEIDHISGSSSDPENLQAVCKPCNMQKARATFRSATPEEAVVGNAIWRRIRAEQPLRLCDDEMTWNTRRRDLAAQQRTHASHA